MVKRGGGMLWFGFANIKGMLCVCVYALISGIRKGKERKLFILNTEEYISNYKPT